MPVQYVIRVPDHRGYAGQVAGGVLRVGDEAVVLPSGRETTVTAITTPEGEVEEAFAPLSVTVELADELDVSRGDLIARVHNQPTVTRELDAMVCWLNDRPLEPRGRYAIKHTTRSARALVDDVRYRIDVNTLHREGAADSLALNDIGRVRLRTSAPLLVDEYRRNR